MKGQTELLQLLIAAGCMTAIVAMPTTWQLNSMTRSTIVPTLEINKTTVIVNSVLMENTPSNQKFIQNTTSPIGNFLVGMVTKNPRSIYSGTPRWDNPCLVSISEREVAHVPARDTILAITRALADMATVLKGSLDSIVTSALTFPKGITDLLRNQTFAIMRNHRISDDITGQTRNDTNTTSILLHQYVDFAALTMALQHIRGTVQSTHSRDIALVQTISRVQSSVYVTMCAYNVAIANDDGTVPSFANPEDYLPAEFLSALSTKYEYLRTCMTAYVVLEEAMSYVNQIQYRFPHSRS